jgi:hypothetical protein
MGLPLQILAKLHHYRRSLTLDASSFRFLDRRHVLTPVFGPVHVNIGLGKRNLNPRFLKSLVDRQRQCVPYRAEIFALCPTAQDKFQRAITKLR